MNSIRATIRDALRDAGLGQYERQVDPIITVLERREVDCIKALRDYAVNEMSGVDENAIDTALSDCGLDMEAFRNYTAEQQQQYSTPADSQQQGAMTGDVQAQLADLQRQVQALREAAQRMGVTV